MIIEMLEQTRGSDDEFGRYVKTYLKGRRYEMTTEWQVQLAEAFIDTKRAKKVNAPPSPPELPVGDIDNPDVSHPEKVDPDKFTWKALQEFVKKLSGETPKSKAIALMELRKHNMLKE